VKQRATFLGAVLASISLTACTSPGRLPPDFVGVAGVRSTTKALEPAALLDAKQLPALEWSTGRGPARPAYRVAPLDEIVVQVWGRPDLGSQIAVGFDGKLKATTVREDGKVSLPFLGIVAVAGKTISEIQAIVQSSLAKIIENPQVEVSLHSCRSQPILVGGQAVAPGTYFLCEDRLTVGELVTSAKGLAPDADLARGVLSRGGTRYALDYHAAEQGRSTAADILLQAGDTIYFPSLAEQSVYVFGEVVRQGNYNIPKAGLTILDALGLSGGFVSEAFDSGGIFLIRHVGSEAVAYQINFSEFIKTPEIPLAPGDRIFVATSGLERWARWWARSVPFLRIVMYRPGLTVSGF